MVITSRENRFIREYRHLQSDGKYRRQTHRFVLEGARLCEDAARSDVPVVAVLYTEQAAEQYPSQLAALAACEQRFIITDSLASYIGDTATPQGVFCICERPQTDTENLKTLPVGRYAALETVQDPTNLGTMIRTAEALGLDGLILSDGCCDPYNPKVLRGSMGGVFRLPLYTAENLPERLRTLSLNGFTTVACVVDGEATPITALPFDGATIVVIGNEGNGLTAETVAACSVKATIPMKGRAESLNASMAAGIVFWEMMRKDGVIGG